MLEGEIHKKLTEYAGKLSYVLAIYKGTDPDEPDLPTYFLLLGRASIAIVDLYMDIAVKLESDFLCENVNLNITPLPIRPNELDRARAFNLSDCIYQKT